MKTSKSKYRSAADFDLTKYTLLFPLLEAVPLEHRTGAVVMGAKGLPVRRDMYARWFRQIARAAGIPTKSKTWTPERVAQPKPTRQAPRLRRSKAR